MGEYKLTILSGFVEFLSKQYTEVLTDKNYKFSEEEKNDLRKIYRLMQVSAVIAIKLGDYDRKREKEKKWLYYDSTAAVESWESHEK